MDAAAWRAMALASVDEVAPELPGIKSRLALTVRPDRIAGVNVFRISCGAVRPENRRRLLMHLHGGYVLFPGEAGAGEGMVMAGYGGFEGSRSTIAWRQTTRFRRRCPPPSRLERRGSI